MALDLNRTVAALRRRVRSNTGRRFIRFVPVSGAAALTSLTANAAFLGPAHMTAGLSGGLAAMAGAAVSYVLSRWAWERKGRPDLLRETLPFWVVSVCAWVALAYFDKLGVRVAALAGLTGGARVAVTEVIYLAGNCLTFVGRFVVFHYVLFAGPGSEHGPSAGSPDPSGHAGAESIPPDDNEAWSREVGRASSERR